MAQQISETDQTITTMLSGAQSKIQAFGASLQGAGAAAAAHFKSMTSMASGQVDVGRRAAESILALRKDETLPHDYRVSRTRETHDAARITQTKLNDGAHAAAGQLESALHAALLPAPHRDTSQRMLIRDEIRTRFSRLDGSALVDALTKAVGNNEAHDAEILGSFGESLLASVGAAPEQTKALRLRGIEKYLARTDGSHQQQAARKALTAFRELNITGQLAAYRQAGSMHLRKVDQ